MTISLARLPLARAAVIHLTELVTHGVDLAAYLGRDLSVHVLVEP